VAKAKKHPYQSRRGVLRARRIVSCGMVVTVAVPVPRENKNQEEGRVVVKGGESDGEAKHPAGTEHGRKAAGTNGTRTRGVPTSRVALDLHESCVCPASGKCSRGPACLRRGKLRPEQPGPGPRRVAGASGAAQAVGAAGHTGRGAGRGARRHGIGTEVQGVGEAVKASRD
jgi:hypothetical protein